MFRKSRKRFGNLKCAAKVEKENSCSTYAFVQAWNMQVCWDKLLHYCLYVSAHIIKISWHKNLYSIVCEAFSLIQIEVSFVFTLLDRTDFPCLCSALVCEWRSMMVCFILASQNHLIFSSFLQEDSETSIQKNLGHVLRNWFLADSVKIISVAVHTSKSRKVKKSDYWQLGKSKPWQKKPTDISG